MYLFPRELKNEVEFDYAIIDLNANAEYFSNLQDNLISLGPNYAENIKTSFPYLLRLSSIDEILLNEINNYDNEKINLGELPFFLFKFKSKPVREPDIVNFLKKKIIYDVSGKKFLYRFYDPRVWILINFLESPDFSSINRYFDYIEISILKNKITFKNNMKDINDEIDFKLIEKATVCNQVLGLIDFNFYSFNNFMDKINSLFSIVNRLQALNVLDKKDLVAAAFHIEIFGFRFFENDKFMNLIHSKNGYDSESKKLSISDWDEILIKHEILDKDIKNKVIYGY